LHWVTADELEIKLKNNRSRSTYLIGSYLEITEYTGSPPADLDDFEFEGTKYKASGNFFSDSPFIVQDLRIEFAAGGIVDWGADFDHFPPEGVSGRFFVVLGFNIPDSGEGPCIVQDEFVGRSP
jgi:hypothetical protein